MAYRVLLSFGAQVEIMEPRYLREVLAGQAEEIYKKIKLDKGCQGMCVIVPFKESVAGI